MTTENQMLNYKIEASKNPSKEYQFFQKLFTRAIAFWIILFLLGLILVLLAGNSQTNAKKIGFTLIGTGGISLVLSLVLTIELAENQGGETSSSLIFTSGIGYFLRKFFVTKNYKLLASSLLLGLRSFLY